MRALLVTVLMLVPFFVPPAGAGHIEEFWNARKVEKSDPQAAYAGFKRCFELAVAAGNADYATSGGLCSCFVLHDRGEVVEAGRLAQKVLEALHALPGGSKTNDILRRVQLFGFFQTGLQAEGRIGRSWQVNRAAARLLRGHRVGPDGEGAPITVAEVIKLPEKLQASGWRLVKHEAELLDLAGRSTEALALLDEAAAHLEPRWKSLPGVTRFYAFKLLVARSSLLDFLGANKAALEMQSGLERDGSGIPMLRASHLNLRLNRLRNLSQWEGPSAEILAEAREVVNAMQEVGRRDPDVDRLLAKMELDLQSNQDAIARLAKSRDDISALGNLFEATYAERDLLIARADNGEENLDAEYQGLLVSMRSQGNKRGEPTLYREYGDYLMARDNPAKAANMYGEALRLTRSFGWTLHQPALLRKLFDAAYTAGDLAAARSALLELEAFLKSNPDIPAARRFLAEAACAEACAALGDGEAAVAALARARALASELPSHKTQWLIALVEKKIAKRGAESVASAKTPDSPVASPAVRPLEIVSVAAIGDPARTRFSLVNTSDARINGHWIARGPGAAKGGESDALLRFDASLAAAAIDIPASIPAGGSIGLKAEFSPHAGVSSAECEIAWQSDGAAAGKPCTWSVSWDEASADRIVLDASSLETDPFSFLTLYHELAVPLAEDTGIALRVRSPRPIRIEYFDAESQALIAIDANGNGDFSEQGDIHLRGPSGVAAAILPVGSEPRVTVEVHLFATSGEPLPTGSEPLRLAVETHHSGEWTLQAEDILR